MKSNKSNLSNLITTTQYESYKEYNEKFLKNSSPTKGVYYRGHSTEEYKLLSTLARTQNNELYVLKEISSNEQSKQPIVKEVQQLNAEFQMYKKYSTICKGMGLFSPRCIKMGHSRPEWIMAEMLELAAFMRHKGIATRMLDWSIFPKIATYFAASNALDKGIESIRLGNKDWRNDNMVIFEFRPEDIQNYLPDSHIQDFLKNFPSEIIFPLVFEKSRENLTNQFAEAQGSFLSYQKSFAPYRKTYQEKPLDEVLVSFTENYPKRHKLSQNIFQDAVMFKRNLVPVTECAEAMKDLKINGISASTVYPNSSKGAVQQLHEDYAIKAYENSFKSL